MNAQPHDFVSMPSMTDPPFAVPPDIVLDLPRPISVNKARRINWDAHKRVLKWRQDANNHLLMAKANKTVSFDRIERFEITIVLNETVVFIDLDNTAKILIDYIRHVGIVKDDAPKNMRRVVIEWGWAPLGCRVIVRRCE